MSEFDGVGSSPTKGLSKWETLDAFRMSNGSSVIGIVLPS